MISGGIGSLRHRVEIQKATEAQDDSGEVTKTWRRLTLRWAAIEPLTGREYLQAKAAQASAMTRIRFRYYPDLTNDHRISWTDRGTERIFEINDIVHPNERREETHAMCRESK